MKITPIPRNPGSRPPRDFGCARAEEARAFHAALPGYAPTPLVELKGLAAHLGLGAVYVKDESRRFGLNAFKALGGSFAMHCLPDTEGASRTFVTATDGNHGRGVAWAAKRLGHRAVVYMPAGSSRERLENIRALGAEAEITDLGYDDCVRLAKRKAEENGWILLQDTAWEGYEEIPARIMQGYTTMGAEIAAQLVDTVPTHIFLQAGVGAMAGAMTGFFADCYRDAKPKIVIVEPEGADCIFRTANAGDGTLHFCRELHTVMAGLSCGEPCTIGWDVIAACADYALTCPDAVAENGMRLLGRPMGGDAPVVSGESGAVTLGATAEIMKRAPHIREMLGLDGSSVVLCISTEGDTDKENYRRILAEEPDI